MSAPTSLTYAPDVVLDVLELVGGTDFEKTDATSAVITAREAARLGRERAIHWIGRSLEEELPKLNVELRRLEDTPGGSRATVRIAALTTYDSRPQGIRRVDLYMNEIARKHEVLLDAGLEMDLEALVELHLAHEFYHVLEFSSGQSTEKLVPALRVRGLLGMRHKSSRRASEVAANAFARAWAGRGPHPTLVDAVVLVRSGTVSAEPLQRSTIQVLNLLNTL